MQRRKRRRQEEEEKNQVKFRKFEDTAKHAMYAAWLRFVHVWIDNASDNSRTIALNVVVFAVALLAMSAHGQHPIKDLTKEKFAEWFEEIRRKSNDIVHRFIGKRLNTIPHFKLATDMLVISNQHYKPRAKQEMAMLNIDKGNAIRSVEQILSQQPVFKAVIRREDKGHCVQIPLRSFKLRMTPNLMLYIEKVSAHEELWNIPTMTIEIPTNDKCENDVVAGCIAAAELMVYEHSIKHVWEIPEMINKVRFVPKPQKRVVTRKTICI